MLRAESNLALTVVGVANSKKMLVSPAGVPLETWADALAGPSAVAADLDAFASKVKEAAPGGGGACIIDCSASEAVAAKYESWLRAGLSVIVANKKANSGPFDYYSRLRQLSRDSASARYLYEATVGAGLPVICSLKSLVGTGDRVLAVEGIFSGTLSFIFNTWRRGQPFSEVVAEAKRLGYTEPDPRDDLSGLDVARKVIILAREAGLKARGRGRAGCTRRSPLAAPGRPSAREAATARAAQAAGGKILNCAPLVLISARPSAARVRPPVRPQLELSDVPVESLVPAALQSAASAEEYMRRLPEFDAEMAAKFAAADDAGEVLRFVGAVDAAAGKVTVGLRRFPKAHAFATLTGSDNVVSVRTAAYDKNPLIIRGASLLPALFLLSAAERPCAAPLPPTHRASLRGPLLSISRRAGGWGRGDGRGRLCRHPQTCKQPSFRANLLMCSGNRSQRRVSGGMQHHHHHHREQLVG